jgi:tetratricopeptide (TPR) repeat protein
MSEYDEMSDAELWELTADEDELERANAFVYLGSRLIQRGEFSEAVSPASAARDLYAKLGEESEEAYAAYLEGSAYFGTKRHGEAIESLTRASDLFRVYANEKALADAVRKLADAYLAEDDFAKASENYLSAMSLYESNGLFTPAGICGLGARPRA